MEDLFEGAVNAEAHSHDVVGRFNVDVRGPVTHRLGQDAVDNLDHGSVVRHDLGLGVVDVTLARTFDRLEHLNELCDRSQRAVVAVYGPSHVTERRDEQFDRFATRLGQRVAQIFARFGHRNVQIVVFRSHGKGHVLSCDLLGQEAQRRRVDIVTTQVGDVESEERGEGVRQGLLTQGAGTDENLTQETARVALHLEGFLQLSLGDQIVGDELIAKSDVLPLRRVAV